MLRSVTGRCRRHLAKAWHLPNVAVAVVGWWLAMVYYGPLFAANAAGTFPKLQRIVGFLLQQN